MFKYFSTSVAIYLHTVSRIYMEMPYSWKGLEYFWIVIAASITEQRVADDREVLRCHN